MRASILSLVCCGLAVISEAAESFVNRTECGGRRFTYERLVGYGELPDDFRDKYGDTLSMGSAIAMDESSWKVKRDGTYSGTLYTLPDRGWNTEGTTAYQPRVHIFDITFNPSEAGKKAKQRKNLSLHYRDTILFKDPNGKPIAGLDPTTTLSPPGFPKLPAAKYTGDGFGNDGPGGTRVCMDPEGLVLDIPNTYSGSSVRGFWISDEYGPYVYHFDASGTMDVAIRPPNALVPRRNGAVSFASDNPPIYDPDQHPDPEDPTSGRANNQGFEGLAYDAEEDALFTMLQSATIQDGGEEGDRFARHVRLLRYDLSGSTENQKRSSRAGGRPNPVLAGEWVVPLPRYVDYTEDDPEDNPKVAAQSDILALDAHTFLTLTRDSDFGTAADDTRSVYRHVDVFSLRGATNVLGQFDGVGDAVSPGGKLRSSIDPATLCPWLDFNVQTELDRFGLKNGGDDNQAPGLLNEKWEGLSLVPVEPRGLWDRVRRRLGMKRESRQEYYLLASSDNDFLTQNGYFNFGKDQYSDASGLAIQQQMLVFKVEIG